MERSDTSMALAMVPVLNGTSNLVLKALQNEAQVALDFKAQLEEMKTKLDPMKAFLSTYNLRNHGDFLPRSCNMRNLIYEAMTYLQIANLEMNIGNMDHQPSAGISRLVD
ncbi:hypothetical protein Patl1_09713 [Pistacia atlantica]|uniref:Uncharacterized protein n=1 Tax=Pistacia atlantica TaxID=434234 RepID=A0ACC1A9Q5_9ROSI|nr:hypothetical protein Patl1_09713 [Pistacia atlantica]